MSGLVKADTYNDSNSFFHPQLKYAWDIMIHHAFYNMGLVRIDAVCYSNAPERIKLIESLGFIKEGVKVGAHYWDGAWNDEILYGLVKK